MEMTLDWNFNLKHLDNEIYLPTKHPFHYNIKKIIVNDVLIHFNHYYSKNTIIKITNQLTKLLSFIKGSESLNNFEYKLTYYLLKLSINKLKNLLKEFDNKESKYIKNILTYKLKMKKMIHIVFLNNYVKNQCYIKFNYDYRFKRNDYSNASLIEIETMLLEYKNYKKQKIEKN